MVRHVMPNAIAPVAVLANQHVRLGAATPRAPELPGPGRAAAGPTWGTCWRRAGHSWGRRPGFRSPPGLCIALTLLGIICSAIPYAIASIPGWSTDDASVVENLRIEASASKAVVVDESPLPLNAASSWPSLAIRQREKTAGGPCRARPVAARPAQGPAAVSCSMASISRPPRRARCARCAGRRSAWCSRADGFAQSRVSVGAQMAEGSAARAAWKNADPAPLPRHVGARADSRSQANL